MEHPMQRHRCTKGDRSMRRSYWMLPIIFMAGCAHKPEAKTEPPPTPAAKAEPQAQKTELTEASARACTQDSDCKDTEVCSAERQCVPLNAASLGDCNLVRVH